MINDYYYTDQLETKRLRTRFLTMDDVPLWSEFFKDPEAIKLFPASFFPPDRDPAELWIERQIDRYNNQKYGAQALIDKESGLLVGLCGLILQEVDGISELEVGYHVLSKYWGKGYAPEAARRFIRFAFENKLSDSIISIIDVRNKKSQRVAEKNGLTIDKRTTWREIDAYIYRTNALT
jgi:RimJ/RimL family protein N-acetyltransferase